MAPAVAAAAEADGWFAFVHYTANNKRLCCRDEDRRSVQEDPSRRWPDGVAAPTAADSVASILSFCFDTKSSLVSLRAIKRQRRRYDPPR